MKKYEAGLIILLFMLSGCRHFFGGFGEGVRINAEVLFVYEDGEPASHERVYVVETIGTVSPTTLVTETDASGRVALDGFFCTPTRVAANGGEVVITRAKLRKSYSVTVRLDRIPNLQKAFGPPVPDPIFKQPRRFESCDGA